MDAIGFNIYGGFDKAPAVLKDNDLEVLFCEETCERTVDLAQPVSAAVRVECDEVCDLLGGPPTRFEKVTAEFRFNLLYPVKRFIKKCTPRTWSSKRVRYNGAIVDRFVVFVFGQQYEFIYNFSKDGNTK